MVMAPVVRGRKGEYGRMLEEMRAQGYARARIDGELRRLDEPIELDKKFKHDISVVVDRLVMKEGIRKRLSESVEAASQLADGLVEVESGRSQARSRTASSAEQAEPGRQFALFRTLRLSRVRHARCPSSSRGSSRSTRPHGCCQRCHGLGFQRVIDPELIVPDPTLSISRGRARALDQGRVDVPPAAAGGRGRVERDRHRHPLAGPAAGRAGPPPRRHRRRAPHGHLPQPLRSAPRLHGAVRRHAPRASSAATRTRTPTTPASGSRG